MNKEKKIIIGFSIIVALLLTIIIVLLVNKPKKNEIKKEVSNKIEEIKNEQEEVIEVEKQEITNSSPDVQKTEPTQQVQKNETVQKKEPTKQEQKTEPTQQTQKNETVQKTDTTQQVQKTETTPINKDEVVLAEVASIESTVNNNINNSESTFLSKVGDKVATLIGFIWYDEPIKGVTYKELSSSAKEKVKNAFYKIDAKIENKIPSYKEKIKSKYTVVSNFIKDKYDDLKYNVDTWLRDTLGEKKYQDYLDAKQDLKDAVSSSTNDIKEVGNLYKEKIKEWYQNKKSQ